MSLNSAQSKASVEPSYDWLQNNSVISLDKLRPGCHVATEYDG